MTRTNRWATYLALAALVPLPALAIVPPTGRTADSVQFRADELTLTGQKLRAADQASLAASASLIELGVAPANAYVDEQTGRYSALLMATPLLPGRGFGNQLSWSTLGAAQPGNAKELEATAAAAFHSYLEAHADALGLDLAQLAGSGKTTAINDDFVFILIPRVVDGVPVRNNEVVATIKYGNLILLGLQNWGDIQQSSAPSLTAQQAAEALRRHVGADLFGKAWKGSELVWVPVQGAQSLDYRLAWIVRNDLRENGARYEALVDAKNGEVFEIQDATLWVASQRRVAGGVYPVSNDQIGADGQEQPGWPMPFGNVTTPAGVVVTDIGGNLPACVDGTITSVLAGPYVNMADVCGAESLAGTGNIDWGVGLLTGDTNCTTNGTGGVGNTKASRTGFNELNMLKAMARSQFPSNTWLQQQLTANMNVNLTCNANWNGTAVNFYRRGGGCGNTGEIAAIFDHEWGHGLDSNDNAPGISQPGEAIADTYAALRLNTSCIGRGFILSGLCDGYGDGCDTCTGVRDIDYMGHASNTPAPIGGIGGGAFQSCITGTQLGPCGREVHCEGMAPAESIWDLWNRKLTGAPYGFSVDKAREIAAQLTFRGAVNQLSFYDTCLGNGNDACAAGSSYRSYVAADDDDGNLANGTPHWVAIDAAFGDHLVGCASDIPVDSGCASAPAGVTTVTATAANKGVNLSWTAVVGAQGYRIYRTDGVHGCDFGKILVASLGSGVLSYNDRGLQGGRLYSYQVLPMGSPDECFGAPSACTSATPVAVGTGLTLVASQAQVTVLGGGDGDLFLDNCEPVRVTIPVANSGDTTLTNLRISVAGSPSHPSTTVVGPALPILVSASLPVCGQALAQVDLQARGLAHGDSMTVRVELTADELGGATEVFEGNVVRATESDFVFQATKTWSFAADADGWQVTSGTFNRATSGTYFPPPDGNAFWQSSSLLNSQCDVIQSPALKLSATSTLALSTNFSTETNDGQWWDRANLGLVNLSSGARTVLAPSGGRTYAASGVNGVCGTTGQAGWAGLANSWAASTWSPAALASQVGVVGRLQIRYGTDDLVNGDGFRFDGVTLTDFDVEGADAQSDTCTSNIIFLDGFTSGNTTAWSVVVP